MGNAAFCFAVEVSDTTMPTKDFLLATKKPANFRLRAWRLLV
jgi:hypothetical protein